jgi:tripartite ATP-independent transporter DctP family solute receptor
MKKEIIIIATLFVVSIFLLPGASAAPVTLKMGTSYPQNSPDGKGADLFAKLVSEKTKGEINVQVYHMEQLGKVAQMIEATMIGNQDILLEDMSRCERFSKAARITYVNYTFRNREHFRKFTRSDLFNENITKLVEKGGLKILDTKASWERGPFRIMISRKPIMGINDLKGLRLRMWDSDAARRSWQAFGAVTTFVDWGEVYMGLKHGMIDAVTSPVDLLYPMKFTEVIKYVTRTEEFPQLLRVYMNVNKFNSLKAEFQNILIDAANQAGEYYTKLSQESAERDINKVIAEHDAVYIQINLKPFVETMPPLIKQLEKEGFLPVGLYDKVQAFAE